MSLPACTCSIPRAALDARAWLWVGLVELVDVSEGRTVNMEDCPVHHVERNPNYPFTCECKDTYTAREWLNVARAEYHGWAAWGEYRNWVRESNKAHDMYVRMLWDYQEVLLTMYRKWLVQTLSEEIHGQCMTDRFEISDFLMKVGAMDYYDGPQDEEDE